MNLITRSLSRLLNWLAFSQRKSSTDAYLAEAVDLPDLERRMRSLDRWRAVGPFGQNA